MKPLQRATGYTKHRESPPIEWARGTDVHHTGVTLKAPAD